MDRLALRNQRLLRYHHTFYGDDFLSNKNNNNNNTQNPVTLSPQGFAVALLYRGVHGAKAHSRRPSPLGVPGQGRPPRDTVAAVQLVGPHLASAPRLLPMPPLIQRVYLLGKKQTKKEIITFHSPNKQSFNSN